MVVVPLAPWFGGNVLAPFLAQNGCAVATAECSPGQKELDQAVTLTNSDDSSDALRRELARLNNEVVDKDKTIKVLEQRLGQGPIHALRRAGPGW